MYKNVFFYLVTICVITHIIRTSYEILKHKKIITANNLSFIIILINMLILWGSWFALCILDVFKVGIPVILRYAGIVLFVSGIITFLWGLFTIKTLESYDGALITSGIYRKIRHPMYSGFILWSVGFPVIWGAVFSFILSFLFVGNILYWRYLEEKELQERFPEYNAYKRTTLF